MQQSGQSTNQIRGFTTELVEIQLDSLEILLDIAERRSDASGAFLQIAKGYARCQRELLLKLEPSEQNVIQPRLSEIEGRMARLDDGLSH